MNNCSETLKHKFVITSKKDKKIANIWYTIIHFTCKDCGKKGLQTIPISGQRLVVPIKRNGNTSNINVPTASTTIGSVPNSTRN